MANAQRVTWATEAGLSAIQRTGYGECWRPSTRLGISADYNVNNMFSISRDYIILLEDTL